MEEGKPSLTAQNSAMHRAAHLLWDEPPKILQDTLALRLCGFENEAALQTTYDAAMEQAAQRLGIDVAQGLDRGARSQVVLRSRYVKDELEQAIERGVSQYVILGAGLDSFAYRKRHLVDVLRIFEVDHPATQGRKRERLKAAAVDLPTNLTFVPLDFEKQSLIETLLMKGYRADAPALFSWLGVVLEVKGKMEQMNHETIGRLGGVDVLSEPDEAVWLAEARFIDELPGAAFAAITLFWVVSTLAGLVWRDISAETATHLFGIAQALVGSHAMTAVCRIGGASSFARSVHTYFDPS